MNNMKKTLLAAVVMTAFGASTANAAITMTPEFSGGEITIGGNFGTTDNKWIFGLETNPMGLAQTDSFTGAWTQDAAGGSTWTADVYTNDDGQIAIKGITTRNMSNQSLAPIPTVSIMGLTTVELSADLSKQEVRLSYVGSDGQQVPTASVDVAMVSSAGATQILRNGETYSHFAKGTQAVPDAIKYVEHTGPALLADIVSNTILTPQPESAPTYKLGGTQPSDKGYKDLLRQFNSWDLSTEHTTYTGTYFASIANVKVNSTTGPLTGTWSAKLPVTITYAK